MKKINSNIKGLFLFGIFLLVACIVFICMGNNRCCEFEKSEISGIVYRTSFSKSGNIFSLESEPKKNYYFFYKKEGRPDLDKDFEDLVKRGYKLEKKKGGNKLYVYDLTGKVMEFEIIHCCPN